MGDVLVPDAGAGAGRRHATDQFADFLYGACLLDWDAEHERCALRGAVRRGRARCASSAKSTDLTASLAGPAYRGRRRHREHAGRRVLHSPVEDSAEGDDHVHRVPGRLARPRGARHPAALRGRRVVDASADTEEEFLLATLDTDEGARRIGELGIGCNPGITRYMRNTLLRREDRRHRPHRARLRLRRTSAARTSPPSTGTSSRTCAGRPDRARRARRPAGRRLAALGVSSLAPTAPCRALISAQTVLAASARR